MPRSSLALLSALLVSLLAACQSRHYVGDGFEVLFPTVPIVGQEVKQTPRGPITLHEAASRDGTMAFIVSYCTQPGSPTLDEAVQGSVLGASQHGKVLRVAPRTLAGHAAREVVVLVPSTVPRMPSAMFRSHILLVGARLYTVLVLAYDERSLYSPEAEAFVSSFHLRPHQ